MLLFYRSIDNYLNNALSGQNLSSVQGFAYQEAARFSKPT